MLGTNEPTELRWMAMKGLKEDYNTLFRIPGFVGDEQIYVMSRRDFEY